MRQYFPAFNERSRYNRRKRDLWKIILAVRVVALLILKVFDQDTAVIDATPVPCVAYKRDKKATDFTDADYGVCTSKAMKYFGYKLHGLVTLTGAILDFMLTAAAPYDNQAVDELLARRTDALRLVFGDKAYNDEKLQEELQQIYGLLLLAPTKRNQKHPTPYRLPKEGGKHRLMVETVNAQLQEQFHLTKHYAKSRWGLFTRIAAKVAGHTIGILINKLLGRPSLALASLAV